MFGPEVSIIFVPTMICNCDCAYCFEEKTPARLSLDELSVVSKRTASYLSRCGVSKVDIYWQGGEIMVFPPEWCLEAGHLMKAVMNDHGLEVSQLLQTNLMDYDVSWDPVIWQLFDGMTGSSLDFPNMYRKFRGLGGHDYNEHWAAKFRAASSRGLQISVISVPNQATLSVSPLDFYKYFVDELGIESIQLNTPFAAGPSAHMADRIFLDPVRLGDFICGLLDVWFSREDEVALDPFQGLIDKMTLGEAHARIPCFFCANCVNGFFCIGPSGEVGQCDAWVGSFPRWNFGNLLDCDDLGQLLLSPVRMKLGARTANLIQNSDCLDCNYFSLCHGGCPVRTMSAKGSPDHADPYCETYKKVFATLEEHVRTSGPKWRGWERSESSPSKTLVWGWPEPGAVVFSSFECTNNCIFCAPAHDRSKNPPDLDREVLDFIATCARNGTKTLFFTGSGEPTLNPSLVDYVRFAKQRNIDHLYMFTNGFGITPELVASLKSAGMENFWVSLHGLGETHDRIVRRRGSFVEAWRALTLIDEAAPQRVNVNTCLNVFNLDQVEKLAEKVLGLSHTTAHCLCLPEWDGNALANSDKMCRLTDVKQRLSAMTPQKYPLTILDNVPYCVAPHLPHIGNCRNEVRIKRRDSDQMVSNADNMGHNVIPGVCSALGCRYQQNCVGVDQRYLEKHGDDEISAILSGPTLFTDPPR